MSKVDVFSYGEYVHGLAPAPHHREMVEFIEERLARHESGVILEPRGHAKTTWGNTIYLSWKISTETGLRVGLVSNTARQAYAFSNAIKMTLERNDRHRELFGDLMGDKWTDLEWVVRDSALVGTKDVNCFAVGAGGAVISKRFDLILCDDIIDDENCVNIDQMEKVEKWFWKTLRPCLAPGGTVIVLGTRWGEGDLYEMLIKPKSEGGKGWPHLVKAALTYDEDHEHPVALWPEIWPVDKLVEERENMGSAMFACAYLNDITGLATGNVFRQEWFQYFDSLPEGKTYRVRMGVDLASSEKERADFTARVTVAEDEDHNHYVLSVVRDKREHGHREFVLDGWAAYPSMERIIIETNQFQSTLVKDILNTSSAPVVGRRADTDKVTRARAVSARYEGHKVFHARSLRGSAFESELLGFPKGHDDMVDALGYAMDLGGGGLVFGSIRR